MYFVLCACLVLILIFVRRTDKSFINPATITVLVWLLLLVLYMVVDHGLYALSNQFYVALLLWVISFSSSYFIIDILPVNKWPHLQHRPMPFLYNKYFVVSFSVILAVCIFFRIQETGELNPLNIYAEIRNIAVARHRGEMEKPELFVWIIDGFAQFCYALLFVYLLKGDKHKHIRLFQIFVFFYTLLRTNKLAIFTLFSGIIVIRAYRGKLKKRNLFLITGIVISLFILVQIPRYVGSGGDNFDIASFLTKFTFSPLTAFDSYILQSNFSSVSFGEHTFSQLLKGLPPVYFDNYNFVYVPIPTNVFTVMCPYYVDWGWAGIVIAGLVHGFIFSYIYKRSKVNDIYKVLYALYVNLLVCQFFTDMLGSQAKGCLEVAIALFLFFYPPCFYEEK